MVAVIDAETRDLATQDGLMLRLKPFVAIVRPVTLLAPFMGIVSGSMAAIGSHAARGEATVWGLLGRSWLPILLGGIAASILNGASNVLNQIAEVELDRHNKPDRVLPRNLMTRRTARIYCGVLYGTALFASWWIEPSPGVHDTFWCVLVAAVASVVYSVKPFYTKARGWLANVTIAVPRGCLLKVAGWGCVAAAFSSAEAWLIGGVFMFFLLGAASTKDFSDAPGDGAAGVGTLVVRLGVKRAVKAISPFLILPWVGFALGVLPVFGTQKLIHADTAATLALVVALMAYGSYVVALMWRRPSAFGAEGNHISWLHMYRMMILAQIGLVVCYLI